MKYKRELKIPQLMNKIVRLSVTTSSESFAISGKIKLTADCSLNPG